MATIPWHRRTEARVVAAVALLVGLSLGATLLATTRVITSRSLAQASDTLEAARSAFYALVKNRTEFAAAQSRLITALPVFRAHMTDQQLAADAAELDVLTDQYRSELKAPFCVLTDRSGNWTSNPGWQAGDAPPEGMRNGVAAALAGRSSHDIVSIHDRLFLVVSEPARFAEEVLGTFTVGYALDDEVARELAQVTHCDVNLIAGSHISGTSLQGTPRTELAALLAAAGAPRQTGVSPRLEPIGGGRYVSGAFPLSPENASLDGGRLLLLQDWAPTQRFIDALQRQFLQIGGLVFLLAVAAGVVFSRRTTRPFQDIAAAAGDIAAGNWTRQVPVRGSSEATTTAVAFNEMSTHLRHWRQEAQDRSERLQASYERFASVTDSARDAIISTDEAGSIAFWSRSAGTIFGAGEEEALGQPLTRFVAESDRDACLAALASTRADGPSASMGRTVEIDGVRKDGTGFPMELSVSGWQTGGATHVTAVVRDVTDRRKAQEALHQREDELRQAQKMEAIGRLAGGVAHDFNNLLTAIRGYAELVTETLDQSDPRREDAAEIVKAADRAASLTRQLLAFSRRQVLAPKVLALDQVVAGTERMLQRLIGEDVELTFESDRPLGRVRADAGQIEQVLVNLAVNARDAMPGGGKLHMELRNMDLRGDAAQAHAGLEPGPYVCLSVSDTGHGMSADTVERIFEPFFTTKAEGRGTGLGLSTVYGIVQQSGGIIEVESALYRGTMFRIFLPEVADVEPPAASAPPVRRAAPGVETVLLAEDDERVRVLVSSVLRRNGYLVLEATNGEQAIQLAKTYAQPIHLLLTDVVMPGMSGRLLAEQVTGLRGETRVLYMSGYSDDAMLRHGVQAGSAQFIQKPFAMDALAAKVRDVLGATSAS